MSTHEEVAPQILTGEVRGPDEARRIAVRSLSLVARLLLYDDLRPGQIDARVRRRGRWLVHERHFALVMPPASHEPTGWEYMPALLVHRERGHAITNQFAIVLPGQEVMAWNGDGDKVLYYSPGNPRVHMTTHAIIDAARLFISPLFINHDPGTGAFEYDMPAPYPEQRSRFPLGTIKEATAALDALTSYLTAATDPGHPAHNALATVE